MFRMSKASIIRSSIFTEQVGKYKVRVIVGSSYGVVRCVLVLARRAVDMGRRLDLRHPKHVEPTKVQ
jgi:hypothetical protein